MKMFHVLLAVLLLLSGSAGHAQVGPTRIKPFTGTKLVPQLAVPKERVLIRNDDHVVALKLGSDTVTLMLEAVGDHRDELGGTFPNIDFVTIRVERQSERKGGCEYRHCLRPPGWVKGSAL